MGRFLLLLVCALSLAAATARGAATEGERKPTLEERRARLATLLPGLSSPDSMQRQVTATAIGQLELAEAYEPLRDAFRREEALYSSVRAAMMTAIGKCRTKKASPFLVETLKDGDSLVRGATIIALGVVKDGRTVPYLLPHLSSTSNSRIYRSMVIVALSQIGGTKARRALVEVAEDRSDPFLSGEARRWLKAMDERERAKKKDE